MRNGEIKRKTKETDIKIKLDIDGTGETRVRSPIGFFNHMLEILGHHTLFDFQAEINGDLEVDQHHLVEDTGLCLGKALLKALGDKKGINRAGFSIHPMDESLVMVALDLCGRPFLKISGSFKSEKVGDFRTELVHDFFSGFVNGAQCNLHIKILSGRSDHHKIEAIFKALSHSLRSACATNKRKKIPSTKGVL